MTQAISHFRSLHFRPAGVFAAGGRAASFAGLGLQTAADRESFAHRATPSGVRHRRDGQWRF